MEAGTFAVPDLDDPGHHRSCRRDPEMDILGNGRAQVPKILHLLQLYPVHPSLFTSPWIWPIHRSNPEQHTL